MIPENTEGLQTRVTLEYHLKLHDSEQLILLFRDFTSVNRFLDRYNRGLGNEGLIAAIRAQAGYGRELFVRLLQLPSEAEVFTDKDLRRCAVTLFLLQEKLGCLSETDCSRELIDEFDVLEKDLRLLILRMQGGGYLLHSDNKPCT